MTTLTSSELASSVEVVQFGPKLKFTVKTLRDLLPDVETALFFAKLYNLSHYQLAELLTKVFNTSVIAALTTGDHSTELQDYLVDTVPEDVLQVSKSVNFVEGVTPPSEVLVQLWEAAAIQIAASIQEVAASLTSVLAKMPSKEGRMTFQTMMQLNKQRPTLGVHKAVIQHELQTDNLVILDVSGSMTENTIRAIVSDVVALSYKVNATLAIVSDTAKVWEPGTYQTADVLSQAEYGGTQYETLAPLMEKDWGVVITIADYDSAYAAKRALSKCEGTIGEVVDISLVNRPTFLAECVGQLAGKVTPLMVSGTPRGLM